MVEYSRIVLVDFVLYYFERQQFGVGGLKEGLRSIRVAFPYILQDHLPYLATQGQEGYLLYLQWFRQLREVQNQVPQEARGSQILLQCLQRIQESEVAKGCNALLGSSQAQAIDAKTQKFYVQVRYIRLCRRNGDIFRQEKPENGLQVLLILFRVVGKDNNVVNEGFVIVGMLVEQPIYKALYIRGGIPKAYQCYSRLFQATGTDQGKPITMRGIYAELVEEGSYINSSDKFLTA